MGGRPAIRKHQHGCRECQRWKSSPKVPKMADLPPARLRLFKPPFWSTGVDCFGPFIIHHGRRTEKRWGIIFKCLTTRCLHLDLLGMMDVDAFLLALRRFISRHGKPFEIWADRGTILPQRGSLLQCVALRDAQHVYACRIWGKGVKSTFPGHGTSASGTLGQSADIIQLQSARFSTLWRSLGARNQIRQERVKSDSRESDHFGSCSSHCPD